MSGTEGVAVDRPQVGQRVRLKDRVDRFPHFTVPEGVTGTISEVTDGLVSVKMDTAIEGAGDYGNCLHFYESPPSGGGRKPDGWDRFAEQVVFIL